MTRRLIELGRMRIELRFGSALLTERFDWRFGPPRESASVVRPDAWIEFSQNDSAAPDAPDLPEGAWQPDLSSRRDGSRLHVEWPAANGTFDLESREGRFEIAPVKGCGLAIDDVLRVVGFETALAQDVLLFHAAAVGQANEPSVDLFAGRSGVGKSTLTERLVAAGESAISDDLVFVGMQDGIPAAFPTPYRATSGVARERVGSSRLRAIHLLVPRATPGSRRLRGVEAAVRVLRSVATYRELSLEEANRMSALVEKLLAACPVFELFLDLASDPREIASQAR